MSLAQQLLNKIHNEIKADKLTLPTLPEVALQVREVIEDPNASTKKLADVIGADTALTARLIRITNSPLMRGPVKIDNLLLALNRLGMNFVQNIVTGLVMEQIFQATNDLIDTRIRQSWEHSKEVASISGVLAKHYTKLPPDKVTLAGLVHEIGILPILTYAESHQELIEDEYTLDNIINEIHPVLGTLILQHWDFPKDIVEVPLGYINFDRKCNSTPDFVDVITVANLQSYVGTDHPLAEVDWSQVQAFKSLGLDPEIDFEQDDVNFKEELTEMKSILH